MLSARQQQLREMSQKASKQEAKALDAAEILKEGTLVRAANEYDFNRIAELWANLAMIQQMQGNEERVKAHRDSGLGWNEFIAQKVLSLSNTQAIIFDDQEKIYGFAYIELDDAGTKSATVKELYIEPNALNESNDSLAKKLNDSIHSLGVKEITYSEHLKK